MCRPSRGKGESAIRQGVDILGKSQMGDVRSVAAAREESESSGSTSRPFPAREGPEVLEIQPQQQVLIEVPGMGWVQPRE